MRGEIEKYLDDEWEGVPLENGKWLVRRGPTPIRKFKTRDEAQTFLNAVAEAHARLDADPELLAATPHPRLPGSNLTARDYAYWLLEQGNNADRIRRALRMVSEATQQPKPAETRELGSNVILFKPRRAARHDRRSLCGSHSGLGVGRRPRPHHRTAEGA
jgi:hypothetical protein